MSLFYGDILFEVWVCYWASKFWVVYTEVEYNSFKQYWLYLRNDLDWIGKVKLGRKLRFSFRFWKWSLIRHINRNKSSISYFDFKRRNVSSVFRLFLEGRIYIKIWRFVIWCSEIIWSYDLLWQSNWSCMNFEWVYFQKFSLYTTIIKLTFCI